MLDAAVGLAIRQQATLSAHLRQAVRLLQLSSLDYRTELERLSASNPFLEEDESTIQHLQEVVSVRASASRLDAPRMSGGHGEWLADEPDFRAQLRHLVRLMRLSDRSMQVTRDIIDCLDDDGYFRLHDAEFAEICAIEPRCESTDIAQALGHLRTVGPPGIGARNLAECLDAQIDAAIVPTRRAVLRQLVRHHLPALAAGRVRDICRALGCDASTLDEAMADLRRLQPRPANEISGCDCQYIMPDLKARRVHGRWRAIANGEARPAIRMNDQCVLLFQRARRRGDTALSAQLHEARWALQHIDLRQRTIVEVGQAIVARQSGFFDHGQLGLKPLSLAQVADDVGIHPSTVSRASSNKYIETPFGIYELTYFFSRSMPKASLARPTAGRAIQSLIEQLIEAESGTRPMSDAQICEVLKRQGLSIARRTVSKYRQASGIPSFERRIRPA